MDAITREKLSELFSYDDESGNLIWKERESPKFWNTVFAGKVAGYVKERKGWKYRQVIVNGKTYSAHRLVWELMIGEAPELIDHVNGDATDNRLSNMRAATKSQNGANSVKHKIGTSKYKGVFRNKDGSFLAQICVNGKNKSLGRFDAEDDAALAYNNAANVLFGEFANPNRIFACN